MIFRVHRRRNFRNLTSRLRRGGALNEEVIAMHTDLTLDAFQDLLDRHGDRLDHWPSADRLRAEALLQNCAEARAALQRAQELRAALQQHAAQDKASPGFVDRVMKRALDAERDAATDGDDKGSAFPSRDDLAPPSWRG